MFVIRLPNGNLQVPETAVANGGRVLGNAYVEITPEDADYERLAAAAITQEEVERRREAWHAGDEALRQEFLEFAQRMGSGGTGSEPDGD
jgi:hypothetical protein